MQSKVEMTWWRASSIASCERMSNQPGALRQTLQFVRRGARPAHLNGKTDPNLCSCHHFTINLTMDDPFDNTNVAPSSGAAAHMATLQPVRDLAQSFDI